MSATTADAAFPQQETKGRFWHRVSTKTKKAAKKVGSTARRFWSWNMKIAHKTRRGLARGIGYVGLAVTWTVHFALRLVLNVIAIVVLVVLAVVGAVLAAVTAILALLSYLIHLFRVWVVGFFAWLSSPTLVTVQDGDAPAKPLRMTFREYRVATAADRNSRYNTWKSKLDDFAKKFGEEEQDSSVWVEETDDVTTDVPVAPAEPIVEPIVIPLPDRDELNQKLADTIDEVYRPQHRELTEHDRRVIASLYDKERLRVQSDLDDQELAFPGAKVEQVAAGDPYTAAGSRYEPRNPVLEVMGRFLEKNPAKSPVDFSFYGEWPLHVQREALEVLVDTSGTDREHSYWLGRLAALNAVMDDPSVLEESGRAWALIWTRNRRNKAYGLKTARAGFMDEISDLKIQKDKAERREREASTSSAQS